MVEAVSDDEFSWQETHYDFDSRQGRELLFLMANDDWVRSTSEIVDVTSADAVETSIKIDVDLSRVTHEAFRMRTAKIWLPIVLPPYTDHTWFDHDRFAAVTDASGDPLPKLPVVDLRYQMAAAMAEIIAKMAISHLPSSTDVQSVAGLAAGREPFVDTWDQRLLLSAAIYRMLQDGSGSDSDAGSVPARETPRIARARSALLQLVDIFILQLETRFSIAEAPAESGRKHQFTPELAYRAVKVLQALAESIVVVVAVDHTVAPFALTVRVPTRKLWVSARSLFRPWSWGISPTGRLEIDMLLPTADADRQVQINLPEGVSIDSPRSLFGEGGDARSSVDIIVDAPQSLLDLEVSIVEASKAFQKSREGTWPSSLAKSFADLARWNSILTMDTLRHYEVGYAHDGAPLPRSIGHSHDPYQALRDVDAALDRQEIFPNHLEDSWRLHSFGKPSLSRRILLEIIHPQTAVARIKMIKDVRQRATPKLATVSIDVSVNDRKYVSTARFSSFMSLALMFIVLCFQLGWHIVSPQAPAASPEVLAIVLTLFVTIQAERIERLDMSTFRGQLAGPMANLLVAASVIPALTLAIALGFQSGGGAAYLWAIFCISAQLVFRRLMRRRARSGAEQRRIFRTPRPDYRHFEALRSDYWRNTTADALMIGRMAYGYVVWQKADPNEQNESISPKLRPLLSRHDGQPSTESSSVLALLRTGTLRQTMTFVVFRGKPDDKWPGNDDQREVKSDDERYQCVQLDLDPGRLAPADSITSTVNVFVGVHRNEILTIKEHPTAIILQAAANKLIVLDVQLPVPAPTNIYRDRQWALVQVALRDGEDIHRLTDFLTAVHKEMTEARNARHVVAVRTAPDAPLRIITGPETVNSDEVREAMTEVAVLTRELDMVGDNAIEGESRQAPTWRVLAICANARSNIESDILRHLAAVRKRFQLAGLTYTLLHGMAVMVLLVHEPLVDDGGGASIGPVMQPEQDAAALQATLRKDPACARVRVLVSKQLARDDLEPTVDHSFPMLQVRFRWQDRPGAILIVLDSISRVLSDELPAIPIKGWSVSYARVQVLTGQVALGRMTIRMHVPPELVAHWNAAKMEEMARKIESLAAVEATIVAASGFADGAPERPEVPRIAIDRIKITG